MALDKQRLVAGDQFWADVSAHVLGQVQLVPIGRLALRAQLNGDALLTAALAGDRVPVMAGPAALGPVDLGDAVWLGCPLLDVGKRLQAVEEQVLAVGLEVGGLARSGAQLLSGPDDAHGTLAGDSGCKQLVFERLDARLACRELSQSLSAGRVETGGGGGLGAARAFGGRLGRDGTR